MEQELTFSVDLDLTVEIQLAAMERGYTLDTTQIARINEKVNAVLNELDYIKEIVQEGITNAVSAPDIQKDLTIDQLVPGHKYQLKSAPGLKSQYHGKRVTFQGLNAYHHPVVTLADGKLLHLSFGGAGLLQPIV